MSDAELVAKVLRIKLDKAQQILQAHGGLRGLVNSERMASIKEIMLRFLKADVINNNFIRSPQAVSDYLRASLRDARREVFKVIFLDKALRIKSEKDMFFGTIDEASVHPREIVREAIMQDASSVVLVHNHPSGKVEPSREDYEITQKIKSALQTVAVRVLDHIIVGENAYFSFSERNSL